MPFTYREQATIAEVFALYDMSREQEKDANALIEHIWQGTSGRFYAYAMAHCVACHARHY